DNRVGEQGLGELADFGETGLVGFALEVDLEALALTDLGHPGEAKPFAGAQDGLALGVQDLGLEHDIDDDAGHGVLQSCTAPVVTTSLVSRRTRDAGPGRAQPGAWPRLGASRTVQSVRYRPRGEETGCSRGR